MEQNIGDLIQIALLGNDMQQRPEADRKLQYFMENNPSDFIKQCGQIICNEQIDTFLRQAAATLIKKMTTLNESQQSQWFKIDQQTQELVKQQLLQTLISKNNMAQKSAAMAIAQICTNEFLQKKWQDLIPNLANNLNHQDIEIKKAAILTLGMICEQMKKYNQVQLLEQKQIENILMGILLGLKQEQGESVLILSLKALQSSSQFMNGLFENQKIRDNMLNLIVPLCIHADQNVAIIALQTMIDLVKQLYQYMEMYVEIIFKNISSQCMNKDVLISVPAIEIWNTLALEDLEKREYNKGMNHTHICQNQLVQILLQNLLLPNENDDDEDDETNLSTKNSSYKCLQNVVDAVKDMVVPNFASFIENTIRHELKLYLQGALMAICALIQGPSDKIINPFLGALLQNILILMQDNDPEVLRWASICVSKIAEFYPQILFQQFDKILPFLMQNLIKNAKIGKIICLVFYNLADSIQDIEKSHFFFQNFEKIVENLMKITIIQNQETQLIEFSYMACVNLLKKQKQVQVCQHYLILLLATYKNIPKELPVQQQQAIKRGLSSAIHCCLYGMNDINDQSLIETIYKTVIDEFILIKDVTDDGLYIIIGLIERIKQQFNQLLPQFLPYIKHALGKMHEKEVFKASLNLLLQIIIYNSSAFEKDFNDIFYGLMQCLVLPDFDKNLKVDIIQLIGDMSLYYAPMVQNFHNQIIENMTLAMKDSIKFQNSQDEDLIEYSENLKEVLIQTYACLLDAFNTCQLNNLILQIPNIIDYIQHTCDKKYNPTVDYSRSCLALISDIARLYGQSFRQKIRQPFVEDMIMGLKRFEVNPENDQIIKYAVFEISKLK